MNIVLWVFQGFLALLFFAGGFYKALRGDELTGQFPAIPSPVWRFFGLLEIVGAVLLVVPVAISWQPNLTPIAALVLALETLVISLVYAQKSLAMSAQNPLVWSSVTLLLAIAVAYGRFSLI